MCTCRGGRQWHRSLPTSTCEAQNLEGCRPRKAQGCAPGCPVGALNTRGDKRRAARVLKQHGTEREVQGIWVTTQRLEMGWGHDGS